jgi:surface protein
VFNQDISVWNVANVTTHVDFSLNSALSYGPSFPIPPEGFIYTFVYQGTLSNAELEDYIPVKRLDNTFTTFTPIITKTPANLVTVQIEFTFVDNGTTNDGLIFDFNNAANNNVALFYNDSLVSGLTIKQFGYSYFMPLSRGQSAPQGRQFYNLIKDFKINAIQPPQILSNTSLASCFSTATNIGYSVFNSDISNWVTTNVVDMNRMFYYSTYFNQNINTNNTAGTWITSNVTNMSNMFAGANGFNSDIYGWDVSQVVNMSSMFNNTSVFNKNISAWDVSNVTNMTRMFQDSQEFNQDISGWTVAQVTSYAEFYLDAVALDPLNVPLKFR